MLRNKIVLKIKLAWYLVIYATVLIAMLSFYDRFMKDETSLTAFIINLLICGFALFIILAASYLTTIISSDYVGVNGPKIRSLKAQPIYIKYEMITKISPTIFPVWWPIKCVIIEGTGDKGKEISTMISNLHTNYKEALVFIKNHVEEDVIEETLLRYIKRCETKK